MNEAQQKAILRAISEFNQNPEGYSDSEIRQLQMYANAIGAPMRVPTSGRRMAMSALDSALFGLLPGDHAITDAERTAGTIGDVASFAMPVGAAFKALNYGAKAIKGAKAGSLSKAIRGAEKALDDAASATARATDKSRRANERFGKLADTERRLVAEGLEGTAEHRAVAAALSRLRGNSAVTKYAGGRDAVRGGINDAAGRSVRGRTADAVEALERMIASNPMAQRAVSGGVNLGTAGGIHGFLSGIDDGDPFGGAASGAMSLGLLGALGGAAASPALINLMKQHPYLTAAGAGGVLAPALMR